MTKQYFYVDFKKRSIKTCRVCPDYNPHEQYLVVYSKSGKIYVAGYYGDRRTFYETKDEAIKALMSFCKSKIDKYENKVKKWQGFLNDVDEDYTYHEFTKLVP